MDTNNIFVEVWRLKIQNKVVCLIRRAFKDNYLLKTTLCPLCHQPGESLYHIFLYNVVMKVWYECYRRISLDFVIVIHDLLYHHLLLSVTIIISIIK